MSNLHPAVANYFDALNTLHREAYLACFVEDAVVQDPYGGPIYEGREGLNKFFDGMERTWSTFRMTPEKAYRGGHRYAVPWTVEATAKNGRTATFSGVNLFTLDEPDERISRLEGYWDFKGMLAQIRD